VRLMTWQAISVQPCQRAGREAREQQQHMPAREPRLRGGTAGRTGAGGGPGPAPAVQSLGVPDGRGRGREIVPVLLLAAAGKAVRTFLSTDSAKVCGKY
jgi:hypothetical protein